mgnify:CR=1 FL=1
MLALVASLALGGVACSAVDPTALTVDGWSLSQSQFTSQLDSFAKVYAQAQGSADSLKGKDGSSWTTSFTSQFLNDQLSLQLAKFGVAQRGLTITQTQRDDARSMLQQNFSSGSGASLFDQLAPSLQSSLIEGVAAQNALIDAVLVDATSDAALRKLYDSSGQLYKGDLVCVSHILVTAGSGSATPTDAQYATALQSINAISAQLTGTSNFAAIARAKSQDTGSAPAGGSLGCVRKGTFVQAFDDAAWSIPVGQVSAPIKTQYGYHLLLVTARGQLTYDQVKDAVRSSVVDNAEALLTAELARLSALVSVSVDGRYGMFDPVMGRIVAPDGAATPTTLLQRGADGPAPAPAAK